MPDLTEGDDHPFPLMFSDGNGDPIDISGWTVSFTVAERGRSGSPLIQKDIDNHDDPTNGETSFELTASETSGLTGTKRYDIQVTKDDGTIKTIAIGRISFVDGVTDRSV